MCIPGHKKGWCGDCDCLIYLYDHDEKNRLLPVHYGIWRVTLISKEYVQPAEADSSPSLKQDWDACLSGTLHCFLRLVMIGLFVITGILSCILTGKLWVIWGDEGNDLPVTFYCLLKEKNDTIHTWCRHEKGAAGWRLWRKRSHNQLKRRPRCIVFWLYITNISIVITITFLCLLTVIGSYVILRHFNLQHHIFFS